ncbi:hypothetical protein HKX54_06725 [Sulfitobacter sp. M57]|uniref:hypothetical protein n=1 Tax=unclassified Sulfitobacter TaxID=196795 RepID=UPI0023E0BD98|nr:MULTISPECIES: hypothetical protein [unclassified Sulfitobacter]MDF3414143.1 hypothetical protein [Sulfitobacter sp. KE5]MDF3420576.1 hypothetical protein [Sulfitobacter sp. KE43]MDF3432689.1 hypothetical protein [Sulfitobacter sp. KE42]MDF3458328.1 hypothetical protein [Sulfitobacter sp. S74]MDF3462229.1 hypothetical protein [Sulfitobacter sp. Ks18]
MKRLSILSAVICTTLMAVPAQAEPKLFGNAVTMGKVPGVKLSAKQRRALKWYASKKAYFGAFYVVEGTDDLFWTRNFHSMKTAQEAAKTGCEIVSKSKSCVLHAVLYPKGMDPNGNGLEGLGQRAGKVFERKYPKRQKDGKFGAFAINGAYGFGLSFGWDTKKEATEAALAYCKLDSSHGMAPIGIQARKWVEAKKLDKCHVVDTHTPAAD